MPKLFLVRHADAGHRSDWDGPDHTRPLSDRGWRQAQGLAEALADSGATRLIASPYARCVQTLEPLGSVLGVAVEPDDRLAEGSGARGPLGIADQLTEAAVLCSHGDVIPDVLEVLVREGAKLRDELRWQKASTWVLTHELGKVAHGRYVPPPA